MKRLTGLVCLLLFSFNQNLPALTRSQNQEAISIEAVVKQFWQALGDAEVEVVKQTIDFPFTIVESSGQTYPAGIIHSPIEMEQEFKKGQPNREKGKGEFSGLTIDNMKIEMVNQNLAYVTYNLNLRKSGLTNSKNSEPSFSTLTVLRKDSQSGKWKMVFTNIPK